ncbi:uncharacterized protein LOC115209621 [Argonauta hians]
MIQKHLGVIFMISAVLTLIYAESCDESELDIPNASTKRLKSDVVEVSCMEGYSGTKDKETIICENEKWTESEINCTAICTGFPTLPYTNIEKIDSGNLLVTCQTGYRGSLTEEELVCHDGTYSESKIDCEIDELPNVIAPTEECTQEPNITNAYINRRDGILEVTCLEGYIGTQDKEELVCQNGTWTESELNCKATDPCADDPIVAYSTVIRTAADTVEVSCLEGYQGTVEKETLYCVNQTWNIPKIDCADICTILPNFTNADIKLRRPNIAKITCLEGFKATDGDNIISCQDGIWEDTEMTCIPLDKDTIMRNQILKFSQFLLLTALHKNYLVCVFLTKDQTCDCILGKVSFEEWKGKKIVSHNDETTISTLSECEANCRNKKWCVSFEYGDQNTCHLSKTAHYMLSELLFVNKKSVTYYEKVCRTDES